MDFTVKMRLGKLKWLSNKLTYWVVFGLLLTCVIIYWYSSPTTKPEGRQMETIMPHPNSTVTLHHPHDFLMTTPLGRRFESTTLRQNSSTSVTLYHRHDFLKDQRFQFDSRFKNPCWFTEGTLKCLPYFLIMGFRKCGTSSLYSKILQHPEVVGWGSLDVRWGTKETQFFGYRQLRREKGSDNISTYVNMFDGASQKIQWASERNKGKIETNPYILGDASPCTLYVNYDWRYFPGNEHLPEPNIVSLDYVHHFVPEAKIILVFRDPAERLYSEFYFIHDSKRYGNISDPNPQTFHETVLERIHTYERCFKTRAVRQCVYDNSLRSGRGQVNLQLGIYFIYWEELIRLFSRDQILVLRMEDLNKQQTLKDIYGHLHLRALSDQELKKILQKRMINTREDKYTNMGPMLNNTRHLLRQFYRPFNERMATLMKESYFLFN